MPYLEAFEVDAYLTVLTADQAEAIRAIREVITSSSVTFDERIEAGKWYHGLLVYASEGITVFALGPISGGYTTFHMMPFYGSEKLKEEHGAALRPLLSGKSCIKFRRLSQVPIGSIQAIVGASSRFLELAKEMFAARRSAR